MTIVERKRTDRMSIAGALLSLVVMVLILGILFRNAFPTFSPSNFSVRFIESSGDIGQGTSSLLWGQRYLDLLAEAFLVLASAACCVAMLKPIKDTEEKR